MVCHSGIIDHSETFRGYVVPTWNVGIFACPRTRESIGIITSKECAGSILLDPTNKPHLTSSYQTVFKACYSLIFHPPLLNALSRSASRDYGQTQDTLCPISEIIRRKRVLQLKYDELRLQSSNDVRAIRSLEKRCGDNHRFTVAMQRL